MAEQRGSEILALEGGTPVRTQPWLPLTPGGSEYGEEEKRAVIEVIEAQSPFRYYGPQVQHTVSQLERDYSRSIGIQHALAVHSGSTALQVALAALGVGPGTEVILPAFMFVSNVSAVVLLRAIPVFVDVDESLGIDPAQLKRRITPRTRAIVAVHMMGATASLRAILDVADAHRIPVLEDCSQALGATIGGRPVGSWGAISVASLQFNKNITTGEGGLVATNDDELNRRAVAFHDVGCERTAGGVVPSDGSTSELWGIGARMDEIRGALGVVQLKRLPGLVTAMRSHHSTLCQVLEQISDIRLRPLADPDGHTGAVLSWLHSTPEAAERFRLAMRAEGIPVSPPWGGLHLVWNLTALLKKAPVTTAGCPWACSHNRESITDYSATMLPRSQQILARTCILSLPPRLTLDDVADAARAFLKVRDLGSS